MINELGRIDKKKDGPGSKSFAVIKEVLTGVVNFVFPSTCINCHEIVGVDESVCIKCWQGLQFIEDPICDVCGKPFDFDANKFLCNQCMQESKHYISMNRSVFIYNDISSKIIMRYKHGDDMYGLSSFAIWMKSYGAEVIDCAQVITSVPLHFNRLFYRKFNQASLLANELSRVTGIPKNNHLLLREKNTPSQGKKKAKERKKNVSNVFKVNNDMLGSIKNKNILIVDDVYTTGSTLKECAKVLLRAGARKIFTLTLARVK